MSDTKSAGTLEDIYEAIPHREPFLFIDEVLEMDDEKIVTKRIIRADEPQFKGHYPGNPIMPGVLMCEAILQTGAYFLSKNVFKVDESEFGNYFPVVTRMDNVKFRAMVFPGDEVTIEARLVKKVGSFFFMEGKIMKDGKRAVSLECTLATVDKSKLGAVG